MLTLFEIGPAGYWTGATQEAADDAMMPSGWTARAPHDLAENEFARLENGGWVVTTTPPPRAVQVVAPAQPELVITHIEPSPAHAAATQIHSLADVTCPVGAVLQISAELRDASGQVLPLSDSFRMPMRSRDGRERVLLAHMADGLLQIQVPLRASGVWSVTQTTINEALPEAFHMRFAGIQVFAIEA